MTKLTEPYIVTDIFSGVDSDVSLPLYINKLLQSLIPSFKNVSPEIIKDYDDYLSNYYAAREVYDTLPESYKNSNLLSFLKNYTFREIPEPLRRMAGLTIQYELNVSSHFMVNFLSGETRRTFGEFEPLVKLINRCKEYEGVSSSENGLALICEPLNTVVYIKFAKNLGVFYVVPNLSLFNLIKEQQGYKPF
jgi:hypothetical protein